MRMRIIEQSYQFVSIPHDAVDRIQAFARTCYQSEPLAADGKASAFVRMLRDRGHTAMLEAADATVLFIVDRGVSHELVRHRLASYAQESTRFCNYSKDRFGGEVTFIRPPFWEGDDPRFARWLTAMQFAETGYLGLLGMGATPQEARAVLPNSLKTEIKMKCNFTEWRHVFSLRATPAAHPQMRQVMVPLLRDFAHRWPECFDDLLRLADA